MYETKAGGEVVIIHNASGRPYFFRDEEETTLKSVGAEVDHYLCSSCGTLRMVVKIRGITIKDGCCC